MKGNLRWAISVACALLFLSPLIWVVVASFRESDAVFELRLGSLLTEKGWTLANYGSAIRRAALGRALQTTLLQVGVICVAGLLVNAMAGFAFARLSFRGREPLFAAVVALIILPVEVLAVPMFFTARDLGLTGGRTAALAGLSLPFVAKAFNIYFLRQHFLSLPTEIEEAAQLTVKNISHHIPENKQRAFKREVVPLLDKLKNTLEKYNHF